MSGLNRETPPAGDGGRDGDFAHDPCKITGNIPGTGAAGYGEGLLPFLLGWSEGGPWWPTAIPREGGGTFTATFTDPAKLTEWVDARRGVDNLYFHVNDLSPNTRKKADKGDVTRIRGLHVDIDARAPEGGWPQSEPSPERLAALRDHCVSEHDRIVRLVMDGVGWPAAIPRPTAAVDSGGGCQCFFRLHDDEMVAPDAAEALNQMLAAMLDGDVAVVDVSRIMRLPGTMNLPGKKKRWRGRVDTPTRLVLADWTRRFRLSDFPAPVKLVAPGGAPAASGQITVTAAPAMGLNLNTLPPGVSDRVKAMIAQGEDVNDPGRYPSRSEAYWSVICAMVRAGCTDEQMMGVSLDPDYRISGHVLDQKPDPQKYAARQIAKARIEATEPELAELNAAHVVIESMGPSGKCRIMQRLPTSFGRDVVAFQSFEDFRNRYMHRKKVVGKDKDGKEITMALGKWWLENQNRRQHKTLTFLPGGADILDGDQLNLWNGFGVQPKAGSWALMHQHIREVLADGDDAAADYIIKWAAYAVQHPDKPAEAALVFRGNLGTGKGMFGRAMLRIFGQHGVRTQGANVLDSRFNAHLRDTVLLFADEVDWDSHRSSAQLKGMVTEESLFIEPKGVDATNQPNYLHIIIASNNSWVIPAAPGERRFAVFGVPDHRKNDDAYWDALQAETEGGGLAAMLHDLLAMDLTGWHPRRNIPQTRELSHQKLAGLSGADAIVREMLMGAVAPGASDARYDAGLVLMTRPLIRWAIDNRIVNTDPGEVRMTDAIKRMGVKRRKLTVDGRQQWTWPLPPLGEARAAWATALGLQVTWPDDGDWAAFGE